MLCLFTGAAAAKDWERIENLKGFWRFSIGDDMEWADPDYDDSSWEKIRVPSSWEDQGFHGYNGYAWYRTTFYVPARYEGYSIKVILGYIDDVDEVYLNGELIGSSGSFPPDYNTAYFAFRKYPIPLNYINYGSENTIAVRVFDSQLDGGIVNGEIGVYAYTQGMKLSLNLEGTWKFEIGDDVEYKEIDYDDSDWQKVNVPGSWANYGYKDYDGFGWYRLEFFMPSKFKNEKMVLVLGKIDDLDEAYINGKLVGFTGNMEDDPRDISFSQEYKQFRGYFIPSGVLKWNEKNILAVRVYDGQIVGGIYDGPIGLITQEEYRDYWQNKKDKKNIWDVFFGK